MAIDEPGAIGGAPFRAAAQRRTAGRNFLVSRGMTAQPSGEENYGLPLRQRRSRRSRPSARSAIFRGRMRAWPDRATITEDMRPPRRTGSGRKEHERRHAFVSGHDMTRWLGTMPDRWPRYPLFLPASRRRGPSMTERFQEESDQGQQRVETSQRRVSRPPLMTGLAAIRSICSGPLPAVCRDGVRRARCSRRTVRVGPRL